MLPNGMNNFEILLDNPTATYAPSEIISGKLIIELNRPKSLRALKLRFKGSCKVHWTESRGTGKDKRTVHYNGNEIYFEFDLCVFGSENGDSIEMASGHHVFPFSYNLPANIPSSFEHIIGNVRYKIKAIFDRPWKFDHEITKIFRIEAPYEQEPSDHHAYIGIDDNVEESYCCLLPCIGAGNMSLRFRIPKTVFVFGDTIEATINVNNKSNVAVTNIKLKLEQKLAFHANKTKEVDVIVQKAKESGPFPKNTEVKVRLQVPTLPFFNLKYCSLIDMNYRLHIGVHVSGCHCSTERYYDVIIGSRWALSTTSLVQSFSPASGNYLAATAPPIMPGANSTVPYGMSSSTSVQYNFPIRNENSVGAFPQFPIPSNNPPYLPPMFPSLDNGLSYPPENIHQPYPHIGFVYPPPISPHDNSNEPPPPSYNTVINNTATKEVVNQ